MKAIERITLQGEIIAIIRAGQSLSRWFNEKCHIELDRGYSRRNPQLPEGFFGFLNELEALLKQTVSEIERDNDPDLAVLLMVSQGKTLGDILNILPKERWTRAIQLFIEAGDCGAFAGMDLAEVPLPRRNDTSLDDAPQWVEHSSAEKFFYWVATHGIPPVIVAEYLSGKEAKEHLGDPAVIEKALEYLNAFRKLSRKDSSLREIEGELSQVCPDMSQKECELIADWIIMGTRTRVSRAHMQDYY